LVDLLVGVLHAAEAGAAGSQVAAAVAQTEDEVLVAAPQLHVSLQVLGQLDSWIDRGHVRNSVEVQLLIEDVPRRVITHRSYYEFGELILNLQV